MTSPLLGVMFRREWAPELLTSVARQVEAAGLDELWVVEDLGYHGGFSQVVDALPQVHQIHDTVVTPWDQKGMVMRSLMEMAGRDVELVDGVKIRSVDGWMLAVPDPEEPVTHLWAESTTDAKARRLVQEYARRIRQLVR